MTHHVRCHDDVNQPYARVRDALLANPGYVFRHATAAAVMDAAALRVELGAVEIGADVALEVIKTVHDENADDPVTELTLGWSAKRAPALFPVMTATLVLFPLSPTETRLELDGAYEAPFGAAGKLIDAVIGHRIADAAARRFAMDVAGWLREELAVAPPPPATADPSVEHAAVELEC